ncbi:hypothetical protein BpHYR1_000844 [Brachionus plicatilis]|uniref:Uncharacterized protein n=1 Tax=Brachionus plicatilis TaxID=10195 RepID=A0A3M7RBL7_BRAPC|nr:hypothetical protein BpHYR1_000844 [Brachionus plicatilis]
MPRFTDAYNDEHRDGSVKPFCRKRLREIWFTYKIRKSMIRFIVLNFYYAKKQLYLMEIRNVDVFALEEFSLIATRNYIQKLPNALNVYLKRINNRDDLKCNVDKDLCFNKRKTGGIVTGITICGLILQSMKLLKAGWVINSKNSVLNQVKSLTFLGVEWDGLGMRWSEEAS